MFKGTAQVATETARLNNGSWSAKIKGIFEPGQYRIEVTQSAPVNVTVILHVPPPNITSPQNGQVTGPSFPVAGAEGEPGIGTIKLYASPGGAFLKEATLRANGNWDAQITLPANIFSFYATQQIGTWVSTPSNTVTTAPVPAPEINMPTSPSIGQPVFGGTGYAAGATVNVYQKTPRKLLMSGAVVDASKQWSKVSDETLAFASYTVVAVQEINGRESPDSRDHTFTVIPEIAGPDPALHQDTSFTITGKSGSYGADMEILVDLTSTLVGKKAVQSGGSWSVPVLVEPGTVSLVARQVQGGILSPRSVARAFKVRPLALTEVSVTFPTETTVKFSGTGHTGATVEITVVSGPEVKAPPAVRVAAGQWETTATNWPFGTYSLKAIQKVSDNTNGWIESQPYTFTVNLVVPDPSDVTYTKDYQPTFSGKGYTGATVKLFNSNRVTPAAPETRVSNGVWSSRTSTVWGPTLNREVHIKQFLNDQESANWVVVKVTIPPLAPVMNEPVENGLSPQLSGTCWPGATLSLKYSDSATLHPVVNANGTWSFRRDLPFAPDKPHTVTITQIAAGQTSAPTSKTFAVYAPIPTPVFTAPGVNEEVGRDLLVEGMDGVAGGQVQLKDAQFTGDLGKSAFLTMDGYWSVALQRLEFREYRVKAVQVMGSRESLPTDVHVFKVVVLPPVIEVPAPGEAIARTAIVSGVGMSGARVDVYLEGVAEPLLRDLLVNPAGHWRSEAVTLEIGHKALRARQTFEGRPSKDSPRQAFRVVPAAPFIETPVAVGQVGRQVVVSGFGYAGDEVAVAFGDEPDTVLGRALVRNDRTWSVAVELNRPGGNYSLIAVQSRGEFHSSPSEDRPVVLGSYRPSVDVPAPGRWVSDPVGFAGQGQTGTGVLVSWYNPERVLANDIVVTDEGWKSQAGLRFPPGGQWVRFKQVIHREVSWTYSDWAESARFEVVSSPPELKA